MSGTFALHLCIPSQPLDRIQTKIDFSFFFVHFLSYLILPATEYTVSEDEFDNPRSKKLDHSASRQKKRMPVASPFTYLSLFWDLEMLPSLPWTVSCQKSDR
ncbi:hypothetical protein NPIL_2581 [Nephila pilipes]|uniref:Uncharacterized protein n=1 Tax=Nephila pilipes TaxID=299642 RepID=A0A8X6NHW9_NEPPI|nr:hypothetical protein NPIL_2581 [Nephila pilipes]